MHHLLAYVDMMGAATTDENVNALPDGQITITSNNQFIFDRAVKILACYGQGATMDGLRINSPPLRSIALPRITPFNVAVLPGDLPPLADFRNNPFSIPTATEIAVESTNTGAGEVHWVGLWVAESVPMMRNGEVVTIRLTSTTAATANVWSTLASALEQPLPGGNYEVVGMRVISATGVLARLVFPGGGWRPGCICAATESVDDRSYFRAGKFGSFGFFNSFAIPTVQILCTGATAAHRIYLDVIKR